MGGEATFELTLERIALIRRMVVAWNPAGDGAPIIHPDAPYGSTNRDDDIYNVTGDDEGADEEHRALGDALAVFLHNARLKPGRYQYHNPLAKLSSGELVDLFRDAETGETPEHITFDVTAEHLALLPRLNLTWDEARNIPAVIADRPYGGEGTLAAAMAAHLGAEPEAPRVRQLHCEMQPAMQILLRSADLAPGPFTRRAGSDLWEPA